MRLNDRVRHWIDVWTGEERQIVTLQRSARARLGPAGASPLFRIAARPRRRSRSRFAKSRSTTRRARSRSTAIRDSCCLASRWRMPRASRSIASSIAGAIASSAPDIELRYRPGADWLDRIAPTENTPLGEERRGEVHDENAAALGGVAAHAGLFGTAARRRRVRALVDDARHRCRCSRRRRRVPGSSRALGVGHDAADLVLRHEDVRRARSATPDSPARRCGSIPRTICMW